jgi:hypothetical protein
MAMVPVFAYLEVYPEREGATKKRLVLRKVAANTRELARIG